MQRVNFSDCLGLRKSTDSREEAAGLQGGVGSSISDLYLNSSEGYKIFSFKLQENLLGHSGEYL